MSITVSQSLASSVYCPSLGGVPLETTGDQEVTYTISRIIMFDGNNVTAEFSVKVGDVEGTQPFNFTFQYSGSGNPMDEAESALKSYLSESGS